MIAQRHRDEGEFAPMNQVLRILPLWWACGAIAADTFPLPAGSYAIRSNMVMPHLEEMRRQGDGIAGSLIVKMGGKNMTFSQGISAHLQAACTGP